MIICEARAKAKYLTIEPIFFCHSRQPEGL